MSNSRISFDNVKFVGYISHKHRYLPNIYMPKKHIMFMGKSNVGKSTLINLLCKKRDIAHSSNTPGATKQLNFFDIDDKFLVVDFPGYGFAKVKKTLQSKWENFIVNYLDDDIDGTPIEDKKLANILIDSRRGIKQHDASAIEMLDNIGIKFNVIFTKNDKKDVDHDLIENNISFLKNYHFFQNYAKVSKQDVDSIQLVRKFIIDFLKK